MAANVWVSGGVPVAQVSTATITGYDAATTYLVKRNGKSVSVLGQGGSAATTAVALLAALQASTIPEFLEAVWSNPSGAVITATSATAGIPFTFTSAVSGGAGTFGAFSVTTPSAGPNDWTTTANWSLQAIPVTGDDVYFTGLASLQPVKYGLAQGGVVLNSFNHDLSYTADIGLPFINSTGATPYFEDRGTYLAVQCSAPTLGTGTGPGSNRIRINLGSGTAATVNVLATGTPASGETAAVVLLGTNAANVLNVMSGSVGSALLGGEVATWATVKTGYLTSPSTDVTLTLGPGCTLTTVAHNGGTLVINSAVTTHTLYNGQATYYGTATATTLNVQGGTVFWESSGTITTATVGVGATLDFSRDPRLRTVTNLTLSAQAALSDPNKSVTFTNPLYLQNCSLGQVNLDLGHDFHLQRS